MKPRLIIVPILVLLTAAALAAAATTAPARAKAVLPTKPMSAADAEVVTARAAVVRALFPDDVPGLLIGIWDPAKGVYKRGFGVADAASGRAPSPGDHFRIGSVTKTFTATLVLQLVARGKLRLDDRVSAVAPKLARRFPAVGQRTIRQLLSMRSGLPEYTDALVGTSLSRGWTERIWSPNQLLGFAFRSGPAARPNGTPAVYTNTNYIALGEVLTAVTGKTLPELVETRLLDPLGLSHTRYPRLSDTRLAGPSTRGYVTASGMADYEKYGSTIEPGTDVTAWSASWGGAAGIMTSTLDDLARWASGRFGSALLPAGLQTARSRGLPLNAGGTYGLGLQRLGQWEGHFGGIPGWTTAALRNTRTGTIVVISVNACCGVQTAAVKELLLDRLYPGTTS